MTDNDKGKIRIELRTNEKTSDNFKQYITALQDYIMDDSVKHAKARLELLESIVHVIMEEYGVTPNQMKVIEDRDSFMTAKGPSMWIEVDQSITPIYVLVDGDKEPLKAPKSKTKDDLWFLGM